MTSFSSLLSSISGQPATPQPKPSPSRPKTQNEASQKAWPSGDKPIASNVVAGVKRKPEEQKPEEPAPSARQKFAKTEVKVPRQPSGQSGHQSAVKRPISSTVGPAAAYRGTARAVHVSNSSNKPVPKPIPLASPAPNGPSLTTTTPATGVGKPKRGFAALMEKAKAATEAAKASGPSTIKHKSVEKVRKRERLRIQEETKQKMVGKAGKVVATNQGSRNGVPIDDKAGQSKIGGEPSYKGTMGKKPVVRQEFSYKGTMNRAGAASSKPITKKGPGNIRNNEYVDWDELDDAEDYEEDYESDASSDMMDAGFDDMEREESQALKAARQEDQEALAEEERHKREKLERKRKLQALSKSAAAKKKY